MAHRTFTDRFGAKWEVWDVMPGSADRRELADRRDTSHVTIVERRTQLARRIGVRAELADGWLCFRGANEKRRLAPIPSGWNELSDDGLQALMDSAVVTPDQSRST